MNTDAIAEQHFLGSLLRRLMRRKLLIVSTAVIVFILLALVIEVLPKSYRAVSSVVIEGQTPAVVQGANLLPDQPFDDQTIGTEVAVLESRELLTDTINLTGLLSKPEFNPELRAKSEIGKWVQMARTSLAVYLPQLAPDVMAPLTDQAMADTLDQVRKHVKISPVPRSRVIDIVVNAANNQLAAQIANTMADLYIRNHRDYRQAASREAHEFLDSRMEELRKDSATKTAALENYRIEHGLTTAMTATLIQEQLSGLSQQLQAARNNLADLQARARVASSGDATALSSVMSNPTIQKLREQEGTLVAEQARLAATYGRDSPILGRVNGQLGAVRGQIAAEAHRAVAGLTQDVRSATQNVDSLQTRMEELRKQSASADEARARLATLTDDAQAARTVYQTFQDQLRKTDAAMAYGAVNVRTISHAAVPVRPAFPNEAIMLPAAFVLSLLTGTMLAYLTTTPRGMVGAGDVEALFEDVASLGMIPVRTRNTIQVFDNAIEQLLNRLTVLDRNPPRSILFTSALPEEGKTTTARAVAEAARQRGLNVLLVDADMRSTRFVKPKTSVPQLGLGEVLRGEVAPQDAITQRSRNALAVLPAGSPRGNPTSLLALPSMDATLNRLTLTYDLVIVDGPPALVGGDVEMLSRSVDKTVVLAKWHSTKPEEVALALRQISGPVSGMVLTMVDPNKVRRFGQSDAVLYSRRLRHYHNAAL